VRSLKVREQVWHRYRRRAPKRPHRIVRSDPHLGHARRDPEGKRHCLIRVRNSSSAEGLPCAGSPSSHSSRSGRHARRWWSVRMAIPPPCVPFVHRPSPSLGVSPPNRHFNRHWHEGREPFASNGAMGRDPTPSLFCNRRVGAGRFHDEAGRMIGARCPVRASIWLRALPVSRVGGEGPLGESEGIRPRTRGEVMALGKERIPHEATEGIRCEPAYDPAGPRCSTPGWDHHRTPAERDGRIRRVAVGYGEGEGGRACGSTIWMTARAKGRPMDPVIANSPFSPLFHSHQQIPKTEPIGSVGTHLDPLAPPPSSPPATSPHHQLRNPTLRVSVPGPCGNPAEAGGPSTGCGPVGCSPVGCSPAGCSPAGRSPTGALLTLGPGPERGGTSSCRGA
jgi:hypothetical protein